MEALFPAFPQTRQLFRHPHAQVQGGVPWQRLSTGWKPPPHKLQVSQTTGHFPGAYPPNQSLWTPQDTVLPKHMGPGRVVMWDGHQAAFQKAA